MLQSYEQFVERITKNPSELSRWCINKHVSYNDILPTLPLAIYQQIWKPILDSKGFSPALPYISNALLKFIIDQNPTQNPQQITEAHLQGLVYLAPQLILYHFSQSSAQ